MIGRTVGVHGMDTVLDAGAYRKVHIALAEGRIVEHPLGIAGLDAQHIHQVAVGVVGGPSRFLGREILRGVVKLAGAHFHAALGYPVHNPLEIVGRTAGHIGLAQHKARFDGVLVLLQIGFPVIRIFHVFLYRIQIAGKGILQVFLVLGIPQVGVHLLAEIDFPMPGPLPCIVGIGTQRRARTPVIVIQLHRQGGGLPRFQHVMGIGHQDDGGLFPGRQLPYFSYVGTFLPHRYLGIGGKGLPAVVQGRLHLLSAVLSHHGCGA